MRNRPINPAQNVQRHGLRIFGSVLTVVGAVFVVVGLVSFFGFFTDNQVGSKPHVPELFWCVFVGMPMLVIGLRLLRLGYMGTITRYVAGETAPVATDTVNYVAKESRGAIRDVAAAVSSGLRGAHAAACVQCGHGNDSDARFCEQCGAPLRSPKPCPKCQQTNDAGARFCNSCGTALVAQ